TGARRGPPDRDRDRRRHRPRQRRRRRRRGRRHLCCRLGGVRRARSHCSHARAQAGCRRSPPMRRRSLRISILAVALLAGVATTACRSGRGRAERQDPLLQLSAAESLAEGQRLMGVEKYSQARKYLTHAFEVEPNSTSGREALLLVADSLYKQGGTQNLVQAEAKYRDFLNRFPTSERAPYVQLQIGNALAARVERPDRDQSVTRQAVAAFEDLLRLYPTSEYA